MNAGSAEEAKMIAEQDCGLVMGSGIYTSQDNNVVSDWRFDPHPETEVGVPLRMVKTNKKVNKP